MCLGVPGQVVEVTDPEAHLALVDVSGVRRKVNVGLLLGGGERVDPGDWVLIHVGFALNKIDEEEAQATLQFLAGLGRAYDDELLALAESRIE